MIFGPPTPSHPPPQNFPNCREIYKVFVWCTQAEEFFLGATNNDLGLVSSCVVMMMHASTDNAQRLCGARTLTCLLVLTRGDSGTWPINSLCDARKHQWRMRLSPIVTMHKLTKPKLKIKGQTLPRRHAVTRTCGACTLT